MCYAIGGNNITYVDLALQSTETFGVTSLDDDRVCNQPINPFLTNEAVWHHETLMLLLAMSLDIVSRKGEVDGLTLRVKKACLCLGPAIERLWLALGWPLFALLGINGLRIKLSHM